MFRFDPTNWPGEQERRRGILARFPAIQRQQSSLQKLVQRIESQQDRTKSYAPEFLAELDTIVTKQASLDRLHDQIAREINGALTEALSEGDLSPSDVGAGPPSLGLLPIIAALGSAKVIGVLIGGIIAGYLGKSLIDAIERLLSGQSEQAARVNAARQLSDAYAAFYKANPNATAPSPAELLKLFPSSGGTVGAALGFGTLALIVGGLWLLKGRT